MLKIVVVTLLVGVALPATNAQELWRHQTCDGSVNAFLSAMHASGTWGQDSMFCIADPHGGSDRRELWRSQSCSPSLSSFLKSMKAANKWGENSLSCRANPRGSGHVLRVHYAAGSYSQTHDRPRGSGFYATPTSSHTSMMLSYDVFFDTNFDFVKGGKLPGLWGGSTTCTGGRHSDDCFTLRFMWRTGGQGEVYAYIPREQESTFCNRADVECNFDYGNSLGRGKWTFKKGQWHNIAQYVHLNTVGQHDGYIRVFLDGRQVYEIQNIAMRIKNTIHIDGIVFTTFFGGSDSSWATPHDTNTYFKNFVLSLDPHTPVIIG